MQFIHLFLILYKVYVSSRLSGSFAPDSWSFSIRRLRSRTTPFKKGGLPAYRGGGVFGFAKNSRGADRKTLSLNFNTVPHDAVKVVAKSAHDANIQSNNKNTEIRYKQKN